MEDREAVERAWLALVLAPGVGSRTLVRLAAHRGEASPSIVSLPGAEPGWLRATFGLAPPAAAAIHAASANSEAVRALAGALRERGIRLVTLRDPDYPARLRDALAGGAPPVLYLEGNPGLLTRPAAALAASRRPTPRVLDGARVWALRLAERGLVVVRGESTPFDRAVAAGASGVAITLLTTGILAKPRRRSDSETGALRLGFVHPHWGFKGSVERERNVVQAALADVLAVIEVRPGGIVEQTARRAIAWGRRVLVETNRRGPQAEGVRRLLETGAIPLDEAAVAALASLGGGPPTLGPGLRGSEGESKGAGP